MNGTSPPSLRTCVLGPEYYSGWVVADPRNMFGRVEQAPDN